MRLGNVLPPREVAYRDEVQFARGSRLVYSDFSVEFVGAMRSFPLTTFGFVMRSDLEAVEVKNTMGGVRDQTVFTIAGRCFVLELRQLGSAESWTLVIEPEQ